MGVEVFPDTFGHFGGEPFLHLQAPGIAVKHAGQFRNAHHPVPREIGDRGLADDRCHVVFAVRLERDVLEQDHLVISAHFLEHARQVDGRIVAITLAIFLPRAGHAARSIDQPFACRIIAGPFDQGAYGLLD
jgi:hypothetical protein